MEEYRSEEGIYSDLASALDTFNVALSGAHLGRRPLPSHMQRLLEGVEYAPRTRRGLGVIVFCNFDEGPLDGIALEIARQYVRRARAAEVEPVLTRCRQDLARVMSACPYRQLCVVVLSHGVLGSTSGKPTPPSWLLFHMCWDAAPRGPF
jgi:hypothetical protein